MFMVITFKNTWYAAAETIICVGMRTAMFNQTTSLLAKHFMRTTNRQPHELDTTEVGQTGDINEQSGDWILQK